MCHQTKIYLIQISFTSELFKALCRCFISKCFLCLSHFFTLLPLQRLGCYLSCMIDANQLGVEVIKMLGHVLLAEVADMQFACKQKKKKKKKEKWAKSQHKFRKPWMDVFLPNIVSLIHLLVPGKDFCFETSQWYQKNIFKNCL